VIAPEAAAKLFVTAAPEVRARRRCEELQRMGLSAHYEDVLIDIRARDARDSGRTAAPLKAAPDAHMLDTSSMTIEAAIAEAIALAELRFG
jgi:cytidylate kinase